MPKIPLSWFFLAKFRISLGNHTLWVRPYSVRCVSTSSLRGKTDLHILDIGQTLFVGSMVMLSFSLYTCYHLLLLYKMLSTSQIL